MLRKPLGTPLKVLACLHRRELILPALRLHGQYILVPVGVSLNKHSLDKSVVSITTAVIGRQGAQFRRQARLPLR